jgi:hypothetical protein
MIGFYRQLIILIFGFLLLQVSPTNAQVSLGVTGGITRLNFSGDGPSNGSFDPILGPMAGLSLQYRFSQAMGLRLDAGYLNQRSNFVKVDSNNKVTDSLTFTFDVLTFPLNVMIWTESGRFFVTAGLGLSYFMDARALYPEGTKDISSEMHKFNYYATFGAGFLISLGRPYILIEGCYLQGLRDINSSVIHEGDYLPRTKITSINIAVSIYLPLGKADHNKVNK